MIAETTTVLICATVYAVVAVLSLFVSGWMLRRRRISNLAWCKKMASMEPFTDKGIKAREIWMRDMRSRAEDGTLDLEMRSICEAAGIELPENNEEISQVFMPTWDAPKNIQTFLLALLAGVLCGVAVSMWSILAPADIQWLVVFWGAVGVFCAITTAVCDWQARIIPFSVCFIQVIVGIFIQGVVYGAMFAVLTAALAFGVWVLIKAVKRFVPEGSLGEGDVRAAAAVTAFLGVASIAGINPLISGVLAACIGGTAVLIALRLTGKLSSGSAVPMGLAYAACVLIGSMSPVLAVHG